MPANIEVQTSGNQTFQPTNFKAQITNANAMETEMKYIELTSVAKSVSDV